MHLLAGSEPRLAPERQSRSSALTATMPSHVGAAAPPSAADPVIAAAGDIACSSTTVQTDRCHQKATSDLLVNAGLSAVLTLGDAQYQNGALSDFMNSYDKSWGRVKSITYPSVGNHEYQTSGASGYFDYFNGAGNATGRAGDRSKGYYSFDVGTWHLISLNSSDKCTIVSCGAGLRAGDLAEGRPGRAPELLHARVLAPPAASTPATAATSARCSRCSQDLYNAERRRDPRRPRAPLRALRAAEPERAARQRARASASSSSARAAPSGPRSASPKPNSQVRQNTTYGVLKMTLHPTSYDWQFVPEAGRTFTDSGTALPRDQRARRPTRPSRRRPGNLTATAGTGQVALDWQASTDNVGVTGYRVFRGTHAGRERSAGTRPPTRTRASRPAPTATR